MPDLSSFLESRFSSISDRLLDLESRLNEILPESFESEKKQARDELLQKEYKRILSFGTVVDNRDKFLLGRIKVRIHGYHAPDLTEEKLSILEPIHPFGGIDDSGSLWVPPIGAQVAVLFTDSSFVNGFYLGTVPRGEVINDDRKAIIGQRSIKLFDKRWSDESYDFRNTGHVSSLENEDLPPWGTEAYRAKQKSPADDESVDSPSIFGFKTPEKHVLKFCDGFYDHKLMGKRAILQSSKGNLLYLKDDIFNSPDAYEKGSPPLSGAKAKEKLRGNLYETYPLLPKGSGEPWDLIDHTNNDHVICSGTILTSGFYLESGQGDGQKKPEGPKSAYRREKILSMTGLCLQSVMGHRLIFDDRFKNKKEKDADNAYSQFRRISSSEDLESYLKLESISEHSITLSDHESGGYRSRFNGIFIETASGNTIALCDHMQGDGVRGQEMGIKFVSTSGHFLGMYDSGGPLKNPKRKKFGKIDTTGKKAKFVIKSGFGHLIELNDGESQSTAGSQSLKILQPSAPQGSDGNYIWMMNNSEESKQVFLIKAASERIDSTAHHHIRNIGGLEVVRRNKGCVQINRDYGEDFDKDGGAMSGSVEFASTKYISTEGPIILFGGNDDLQNNLDGTGGGKDGGLGGADLSGESAPDRSIARVLISATDTFQEGAEAPPPAIECPLRPGSGYGCIYIGKDGQAHISPGVMATRQNPKP